jgi:hypothetical protein
MIDGISFAKELEGFVKQVFLKLYGKIDVQTSVMITLVLLQVMVGVVLAIQILIMCLHQ